MRSGTDASTITPETLNRGQVEPFAPIGFALSSICLGLSLLLPAHLHPALLALGLLVGGAMQLLSALTAWSQGRELAATLFSASGLFSLSLLPLLPLPILGLGSNPGPVALASYLLLWAPFYALITPNLRESKETTTLSPASALQSASLCLMALSLLTNISLLEQTAGLLLLASAVMAFRSAQNAVSHHRARRRA